MHDEDETELYELFYRHYYPLFFVSIPPRKRGKEQKENKNKNVVRLKVAYLQVAQSKIEISKLATVPGHI